MSRVNAKIIKKVDSKTDTKAPTAGFCRGSGFSMRKYTTLRDAGAEPRSKTVIFNAAREPWNSTRTNKEDGFEDPRRNVLTISNDFTKRQAVANDLGKEIPT